MYASHYGKTIAIITGVLAAAVSLVAIALPYLNPEAGGPAYEPLSADQKLQILEEMNEPGQSVSAKEKVLDTLSSSTLPIVSREDKLRILDTLRVQ